MFASLFKSFSLSPQKRIKFSKTFFSKRITSEFSRLTTVSLLLPHLVYELQVIYVTYDRFTALPLGQGSPNSTHKKGALCWTSVLISRGNSLASVAASVFK